MALTTEQLQEAFESAKKQGKFEHAYKIEQQLKAKSPGLLEQAGRQAGLTGRAMLGGLAQTVEPFTEPVRYLMNKALPGNPIGGVEAATDELLTKAGVPEPRGAVERGVQSVGRFGTGFGLGAGIANKADDVVLGTLGLAKQAKVPDAPTTEQLEQIANTAYKAADEAGLVIHPGSFKNFADRIAGATKQAGIDRDIHPKASAAVRRIQEAAESGDDIKLQDFEILRRVVGGARKSIEADERRIGRIVANEMDDYLERLDPREVLAGDPKVANEALKRARDAWSRMSKSDMVQDTVNDAVVRAGQFSGSGFENALRTEFRKIALNAKKMRGFTPDEQAAVKKIASGGPIDNAMRYLGKLAPTGVISAGMGGGAGYALGGSTGAVALPAAGAGARMVATKMTQRNVENLSDMVRRGSKRPKDAPDWLLPWLSGGMFGADVQGE